jgi:hypothetical protein
MKKKKSFKIVFAMIRSVFSAAPKRRWVCGDAFRRNLSADEENDKTCFHSSLTAGRYATEFVSGNL